MAKSLKSKSKRQFRRVKREDPKSAFNLAENARFTRLSNKLQESALKPKALTDSEEHRRREEGYETVDEDEEVAEPVKGTGMEVDGEPVKVSTSGPRFSRRESYRTDKGFQVRIARKTEFRAKGEKKRMGCKPSYRK